jgi:transcriptional regulator with XRE-family HTH domain
MSISLRIKQTIEHSGLSQRDFAARVGVHESQVSRWMNDKSAPDVESLQKIASVGGVDLDWLASGKKTAGQSIPEIPEIPALAVVTTAASSDDIEKKLSLIEESVRYATALRVEGLLDEQTRLSIVSKSQELLKQIDEILSRDRSS